MKLSTIGLIAATGAAAFAGAFIGGKKASDNAQDEVLDCLEHIMDDYLDAIGYYDKLADEDEDEEPAPEKPSENTSGKSHLFNSEGYSGAVRIFHNGDHIILPINDDQIAFLKNINKWKNRHGE